MVSRAGVFEENVDVFLSPAVTPECRGIMLLNQCAQGRNLPRVPQIEVILARVRGGPDRDMLSDFNQRVRGKTLTFITCKRGDVGTALPFLVIKARFSGRQIDRLPSPGRIGNSRDK